MEARSMVTSIDEGMKYAFLKGGKSEEKLISLNRRTDAFSKRISPIDYYRRPNDSLEEEPNL